MYFIKTTNKIINYLVKSANEQSKFTIPKNKKDWKEYAYDFAVTMCSISKEFNDFILKPGAQLKEPFLIYEECKVVLKVVLRIDYDAKEKRFIIHFTPITKDSDAFSIAEGLQVSPYGKRNKLIPKDFVPMTISNPKGLPRQIGTEMTGKKSEWSVLPDTIGSHILADKNLWLLDLGLEDGSEIPDIIVEATTAEQVTVYHRPEFKEAYSKFCSYLATEIFPGFPEKEMLDKVKEFKGKALVFTSIPKDNWGYEAYYKKLNLILVTEGYKLDAKGTTEKVKQYKKGRAIVTIDERKPYIFIGSNIKFTNDLLFKLQISL